MLPWKNKKYYIFWVCVCSLRYPTGNAHAPYWRHLWPVRLNNIFPLYLINDTIFEEKKLDIKWVFWFSVQLWSEIERHMIKKIFIGLYVKYLLCLSDFNETWIFLDKFSKNTHIKFHENPSSGSRVVPCGRADGQTNMTKQIVAFRSFANAPQKLSCKSVLQNPSSEADSHPL